MNKKLLENTLKTIGIGFFSYILSYDIALINSARVKHNDKCDVIFILGGNVLGEATPDIDLRRRMEKALLYLNENPECIAIATGGCFRKNQKKSEALIIKEYLVSNKIAENRIILEENATTTEENFKFGKEILLSLSEKPLYEQAVGFLTSDYHILRTGIIAKKYGLPGLKRVSAPSGKVFLKALFREPIAALFLLF